jgi:hypothetical protein
VVVNLGADVRRPEVKKNLGAVNSWPPSWQAHRRRLDSRSESRRRGGKQSHAAQGRATAITGVLIGFSRRAEGKYGGCQRSGVQRTGGEDLSTQSIIPEFGA